MWCLLSPQLKVRSLSLFLSLTHTLSLSLSLSHTHSLSLSLSLSLTHTHIHGCRQPKLPGSATEGHYHPGGNPVANLKSISHRCYLQEEAFEWRLTKETIDLPLGCLQGGIWSHSDTSDPKEREREREREGGVDGERERESVCVFVCVCGRESEQQPAAIPEPPTPSAAPARNTWGPTAAAASPAEPAQKLTDQDRKIILST